MKEKNTSLLTQPTDDQLKEIMKSLLLGVFDGQAFQIGSILQIFQSTCEAQSYEAPELRKQYNLFYSIRRELEREGIIKTIKQGTYYVSSDGVDDYEDAPSEDDAEVDDQDMLSEEASDDFGQELDQVGEGSGEVYVYYYPSYKLLAELQNREEFRCKIGMTRAGYERRFATTQKTEEPEHKEIGLVIKTDSPEALEKLIHSALTLRGKRCTDTPGKEWFLTSPQMVKSIYVSMTALNLHPSQTGELGFI